MLFSFKSLYHFSINTFGIMPAYICSIVLYIICFQAKIFIFAFSLSLFFLLPFCFVRKIISKLNKYLTTYSIDTRCTLQILNLIFECLIETQKYKKKTIWKCGKQTNFRLLLRSTYVYARFPNWLFWYSCVSVMHWYIFFCVSSFYISFSFSLLLHFIYYSLNGIIDSSIYICILIPIFKIIFCLKVEKGKKYRVEFLLHTHKVRNELTSTEKHILR